MGFRNPFRITLDKNDVAYVTDYSPDSQVPQMFRGPQGTGRVEVVRKPANYGWPLWREVRPAVLQVGLQHLHSASQRRGPEPHECDNPARGPQNTSRWVANGGPAVEPGLEYGPPITQPEIWYSYRDNQAPPNGPRHAVLRPVRARRAAQPGRRVSAAVPGGVHGCVTRTAPRRTTTIRPTPARRSSRRTSTARSSSASSLRTP